MLRWVMKVMGQGLVALIPIALTLGLVVWLGMWVESLVANPLKELFPQSGEAYRLGMGILCLLVILFLFGLLMRLWLVRKLLEVFEGWIMRLPLVKTLFGAIKDVMRFVGGEAGAKKGDMVVMLTLDNGWRQIGIVTRQDFTDLPKGLAGGESTIAVYVPFSYQLGGFTYFIDASRCEPVPGMSVEDAMRMALMAWLGSGKGDAPDTPRVETDAKKLP